HSRTMHLPANSPGPGSPSTFRPRPQRRRRQQGVRLSMTLLRSLTRWIQGRRTVRSGQVRAAAPSFRGSASSPRRPRVRPHLEPVEDRLAPVVGALDPAPTVPPGTGLDGVVRLDVDAGAAGTVHATGSLLFTGRHILTAAHFITDGLGKLNASSVSVTFQ